MEVLKLPFIFLCYGWMNNTTVIFLVESSERFWKWMLKRMLIFKDCFDKKIEPSKFDLPFLGNATKDLWHDGKPHGFWEKDRELINAKKYWKEKLYTQGDTFYPPEPSWELYDMKIDPNEADDRYKPQSFSKLSGRVSDKNFRKAIDCIYPSEIVDIIMEERDKKIK